MKNVIVCKNCNSENPNYIAICKTCKSYLRERVVNIDLWSILWNIVENPKQAFTKIVYAEHKNFVIFLLFMLSVKYFIYSLILAVPIYSKPNLLNNIYSDYSIFAGILLFLILLMSGIYKILFKAISIMTRFRDILSVLTYSQIPIIFALIIFFPVEMVLFGDYLFTFNPTPFAIKPTPAYVLLTIELLMILWSGVLSIIALYVVSRSKVWSIILGLIYMTSIFTLILLSSRFII